jgi:hypothetical protein
VCLQGLEGESEVEVTPEMLVAIGGRENRLQRHPPGWDALAVMSTGASVFALAKRAASSERKRQ